MTEEEAQTKACCKPGITPRMSGCCIASECMAWRTRHQWFDNAQQEPSWVQYSPYAFEPGPGQERDDGYCGLAGEPR